MRVNIELDSDILIHLNVELFNAVFTKNTEYATSWILPWHFDNIVLRHP